MARFKASLGDRQRDLGISKVSGILGNCDSLLGAKVYASSMAKMAELDIVKAAEKLEHIENVGHLKYYVWRKNNPEEPQSSTNFGNCLN